MRYFFLLVSCLTCPLFYANWSKNESPIVHRLHPRLEEVSCYSNQNIGPCYLIPEHFDLRLLGFTQEELEYSKKRHQEVLSEIAALTAYNHGVAGSNASASSRSSSTHNSKETE